MAATRDGLPSVVMKDVSPGFFSSSSSPYPVFGGVQMMGKIEDMSIKTERVSHYSDSVRSGVLLADLSEAGKICQ